MKLYQLSEDQLRTTHQMKFHIHASCGPSATKHETSSVSHAAAWAADLAVIANTVIVFDYSAPEDGYLEISNGAVLRNGTLSAGLIEIADSLEQLI